MATPFKKVPTTLDFPKEEAEVLAFWKERRIFERSLEATRGGPPFVFYEGPPTANGLPHNGHVLTRVIKDLFPRYKTMRGYHVPRKGGWDTHGLPVEVEVEKELRIHGKAAIVEYGVEPFAKKCIESVFRYTTEWETLTDRVGFWVDLPSAYVTFHRRYIESVWWALSELFRKGLLYQGHKVVWWWAQGGTALSSGEVGLGYKTVDDPSVFVAFPLADGTGRELLVWTTTPWTLPSNMYAAVNPKHEYADVAVKGRVLVVAKGLVDVLAKKLGEVEVRRTFPASELVGLEYAPPFDLYRGQHTWRVISADFVTLDAGSGIVHVAPAFGEDDFNAFKKVGQGEGGGPPAILLCAVKPDGTFVPELTRYAGRWVKDCDRDITRELDDRGLLVHHEIYRHDYPFCWRSDQDPLIQFARPAWYIRTTALKEAALANNRAVDWLPEHVKTGRFGDFLENNVDWALSRERFWGTPLNVWVNDVTGKLDAPASVDEILARNPRAFDHFHAAKAADPTLSDHLLVHKPWIDQVTWQVPGEEGTYRRVPEVIDCWFDSGCMPFAQWGFPLEGKEEFARSFPADFISEAIDQTRGWFYSLLMISTLVFDDETLARHGLTARTFPHPYRTCIVLGHVCDKEGKKESKSKGNYTPPGIILDAVEMDFAVLGETDAPHLAVTPGQAWIAREDMEGLDLEDGARVHVQPAHDPRAPRDLVVRAGKKLRRRVVVLAEADRAAMGVAPTGVKDVPPVEVPRLPARERVTLRDPASSAPGADAFRWFFYASNPPWNNTRHSLSNVRALQKETLIKLRNVYSFFTIYANIDAYDPSKPRTLAAQRGELDRWILGELAIATGAVTGDLDRYDVYAATGRLAGLVDALSNWWVRRSRRRFWRPGMDDDKRGALDTLWECLLEMAKLMAPFVPFSSDAMYRNLSGPLADAAHESVHLARYPEPATERIDLGLSARTRAVRELVSLGLQVRTQAKLKVRQPLRTAHLVVADRSLGEGLAAHAEMIREELNVLSVSFVPEADVERFVTYRLKPSFRSLGQRGLGKQAQELKKSLAALSAHDAARVVREVESSGTSSFGGVDLGKEDLEVAFDTLPGFAAAGARAGVVVLDTRLDDELVDLGFVRELTSRLQAARKEMNLEYTDRVRVRVDGTERAVRLVGRHQGEIAGECLAEEMTVGPFAPGAARREMEVEGEAVSLAVERI